MVDYPEGSMLYIVLFKCLPARYSRAGLLRECLAKAEFDDPARLAAAIKAMPLRLVATRPLDEAISSAGGVAFDAVDETLMLRAFPGVACAGEMLDWEAPTGGYSAAAGECQVTPWRAKIAAILPSRTAAAMMSPTA